eukprot:scaffold166476_cov23-Cyclotella_meneghiniana.AAC.1
MARRLIRAESMGEDSERRDAMVSQKIETAFGVGHVPYHTVMTLPIFGSRPRVWVHKKTACDGGGAHEGIGEMDECASGAAALCSALRRGGGVGSGSGQSNNCIPFCSFRFTHIVYV